jgi:hypothetical protein
LKRESATYRGRDNIDISDYVAYLGEKKKRKRKYLWSKERRPLSYLSGKGSADVRDEAEYNIITPE